MKRAFLSVTFLIACGDNVTQIPDREAYSADPVPLACFPNLDGEIHAEEMPTALALPITYRVSPAGAERSVDVAGTVNQAGERSWQWTTDDVADRRLEVVARELGDHWYASSFPEGEFVLPVDAGRSVEGIYARDESGIYLLGIASAEENPSTGQTLLVYAPRVQLFAFPVRPAQSWTSIATVTNAMLFGLPYAGTDTYAVQVDSVGRLMLPDLTFEQVHRVRTTLTEVPVIGLPRTLKQVSFASECFGEVARAVSRDGETKDDFTIAAEIRRLGL